MSELLRRDIHPADVVMPSGGRLRGARVFVTTDRVLIYTTGTLGIRLAHDLRLAEPGSVPANRATLNGGQLAVDCEFDLSEGTQVLQVIVNRGDGCGCGSPLKALKAPVGWHA